MGKRLGEYTKALLLQITLFTGLGITLSAQADVNEDIHRLNLRIFESENLVMKMEYRLYLDGKLSQTMQGRVVKSKHKLHQKIGNNEVIRDDHYYVTYYPDQKILSVFPFDPSPKYGLSKKDILSINIDSLQRLVTSVQRHDDGTNRRYDFLFSAGELSAMTVEFEASTFTARLLSFTYREKVESAPGQWQLPRMEIEFTSVEFPASVTNDEFTFTQWLSIGADNKVTLKPAYKGYTLINELPQKKKSL